MKKIKSFSIVSIAVSAAILAICLFMIFGLKLLIKDNEGWDTLGAALVTVIFILPGSSICGVLSILSIMFRSIFLAKGKRKLSIICLPLNIVLFLVSAFLAILVLDNPSTFAIITLVAVVTMSALALLAIAFDIVSIILTKNKEEIINE